MAKSEKQLKREAFMKMLKKKTGDEDIITRADAVPKLDAVTTGSIILDQRLKIGGFPRGRITTVTGFESSGKTTVALTALADFQKQNPEALGIYFDAEASADEAWLKKLGVDVKRLEVVESQNLEFIFESIMTVLDEGIYDFIILDSFGALTLNMEEEESRMINNMNQKLALPLMIKQGLRKIVQKVKKTNAVFVGIAHGYVGDKYKPLIMAGGTGPKYYSSQILEVTKIGEKVLTSGELFPTLDLEDEAQPIGNRVRIKIRKNKAGGQGTQCETRIIFENPMLKGLNEDGSRRIADVSLGFDRTQELLELANEMKIITEKSSRTVEILESVFGEYVSGTHNQMYAKFHSNKDLLDKLEKVVIEKMKNERQSWTTLKEVKIDDVADAKAEEERDRKESDLNSSIS